MKKEVKTITKEYDGNGNLLKHTEQTVIEEVENTYPWDQGNPWSNPSKIPPWYEVTCGYELRTKTDVDALVNGVTSAMSKVGVI